MAPMGALLSPQEPARTSGRTSLKGDRGEKVRGGGKGCPSPAAPIPGHLALLPFLPPVPGLCRELCPRGIQELSAAGRAAGTPAAASALLPQAGIEAPLNSPPLLEQSQPWPRASLFPLSMFRALPELGGVSSTPSAPSPHVPVPPGLLCPHRGVLLGIPGVQTGCRGTGAVGLQGLRACTAFLLTLCSASLPHGVTGVPLGTPSEGVRCGAGPGWGTGGPGGLR